MRRIWIVMALICMASAAVSGATSPEFRGIWVDAFHDGFKTPEQTTEMVNKVADANLNAIFVQVRKRGDAYYNSAIVPKAKDIANDYDPLADIIQKAHARGIEVHAWLHLIEAWNTQYGEPTAGHVCADHPDWLTKLADGRQEWYEGRLFLDPGHPDVQAYLVAVVNEVARRYAVDGIHLGELVYPTRGSGYNETSLARFKAECQVDAAPDGLDPVWRQWRQDQLTNLIVQIHKWTWPGIKLSVATRPNLQEARVHYMQDWPMWLQQGLLDFAAPMNYRPDSGEFDANLIEEASNTGGRHVYIGDFGIGMSASEQVRRLTAIRASGCPGFVLYNYSLIFGPNADSSQREVAQAIKTSITPQPASVPVMPWKQQGGQ